MKISNFENSISNVVTPVGYAIAMLLGLICKLSEGCCREAKLVSDKQTNKQIHMIAS